MVLMQSTELGSAIYNLSEDLQVIPEKSKNYGISVFFNDLFSEWTKEVYLMGIYYSGKREKSENLLAITQTKGYINRKTVLPNNDPEKKAAPTCI